MLNSTAKIVKKASSASYKTAAKSIKFSQQIFIKRAERLSKVSKKVCKNVAKFLLHKGALEFCRIAVLRLTNYSRLLPHERKAHMIELIGFLWKRIKLAKLDSQNATFLTFIEQGLKDHNSSFDLEKILGEYVDNYFGKLILFLQEREGSDREFTGSLIELDEVAWFLERLHFMIAYWDSFITK